MGGAVRGRIGLNRIGFIPWHGRILSRSSNSIFPDFRLAQTQLRKEMRDTSSCFGRKRFTSSPFDRLCSFPPQRCGISDNTVSLVHVSTSSFCHSTSVLSAVRRSVMTSSRARKYQSEPLAPERVSISTVSVNTLTFALSDTTEAPTPERRFDMRSA